MKYIEIEEYILSKIRSEEYQPDQKIPSEYQLSELFNVSRMTVHKAINNLVARGILYKLPRKGIYVVNQNERYTILLDDHAGFSTRMGRMGKSGFTKVIRFELREPDSLLRKKINLEKNEKVFYIERLRLIDDEPIVYEINYIRQNRVNSLSMSDLERSFEKYLEENKIYIKKIVKEFVAVTPDRNLSEILQLLNTASLLRIDYTSYLDNDEIFRVSQVYYNQNKCRFLQIINL